MNDSRQAGKDAEQRVEDELRRRGYPIFYRNLNVYYNGHEITELDIVSSNFIVEVKSKCFKNTRSGGFDMFYRHNLLPTGFTYFVYSPEPQEELNEYQKMYNNPSYFFINDIEQIARIIQPSIQMTIPNESILARVLNMTTKDLEGIDKLYVPSRAYKDLCHRLMYERDVYYAPEELYWSVKLEDLVKRGKVCFDAPSPYAYPLKTSMMCNVKKLYIKSLDKPIVLDLYYHISAFQKCPDMQQIYFIKGSGVPKINKGSSAARKV